MPSITSLVKFLGLGEKICIIGLHLRLLPPSQWVSKNPGFRVGRWGNVTYDPACLVVCERMRRGMLLPFAPRSGWARVWTHPRWVLGGKHWTIQNSFLSTHTHGVRDYSNHGYSTAGNKTERESILMKLTFYSGESKYEIHFIRYILHIYK